MTVRRPDFESEDINATIELKQGDDGQAYLKVSSWDTRFYPNKSYLQNGLNLAYKINTTRFTDSIRELRQRKVGEWVRSPEEFREEENSTAEVGDH